MSVMTRSSYGLDSPRAGDWSHRGLCRAVLRGEIPDVWWSLAGSDRALAKHLCLAHCPVLESCAAALAGQPRPQGCVIAGTAHDRLGNVLESLPRRARCPHCDRQRSNSRSSNRTQITWSGTKNCEQ